MWLNGARSSIGNFMKNASLDSPLIGQNIWLSWLRDLGGTFNPVHNLDEPKVPTGRRDPDKKPRRYELDDEKYGMDPKTGTIWRRPVTA